jgi:hypothetical protein
VEAHKEDILVFEMQMYVTVQFSVFASDFFCCHIFDTGIYTEEYKIYKCMLCLKIVSLIGMCVCVCVHARVARHTVMSRKQHKFGILASGQRSLRTDMPNYAFLLNKLCLGVCFKDKWEHNCHSWILLSKVGQFAETLFRYTTKRTIMHCHIVSMN